MKLPAPLASLGVPSHIGMVVPDREAAIAELEPLYGPWVRLRPREGGTHIVRDGRRSTVRLTVAWTEAGPVHLELLQGLPGTVWEPRPHGYIHHYGFQVDDLEAVSARLVEAGMAVEVTRWHESGRPFGFAYLTMPSGLRVEIQGDGPPRNLAEHAAWARG